jgi:alanine racemase
VTVNCDAVAREVADEAAAMARSGWTGGPLRVHVEVDTGMTRGGLAPADTPAAVARLAGTPGVLLEGLWTHLSTPEDPALAGAQVGAFGGAARVVESTGIAVPVRHVATSGSALLRTAPGYDLVRIGVAAYGIVPDGFRGPAGDDHGLTPALSLRAHPVRIEEVARGTRVGYGGDWRAAHPSVIATVPVGYADGYARSSWPGAEALVRGRRVPIVGRVSMDAVTIDVTDVPGVSREDVVVLIGSQGDERIGAQDLATLRRTISWEVVSTLSARLARVYREDGRPVAVRQAGSSRVQVVASATVQAAAWTGGAGGSMGDGSNPVHVEGDDSTSNGGRLPVAVRIGYG